MKKGVILFTATVAIITLFVFTDFQSKKYLIAARKQASPAKAEALAKSALRLNPRSSEANLIIAESLLRKEINDSSEALPYLENAERIGSDKIRIYSARLSVEMREADWQSVIEYANKLLLLDEDNYKARFALSEAMMETNGDPLKIIYHAEKALNHKDAVEEFVLQTLAMAHLRAGNKESALKLINEAITINQISCLLYLSRARILSSFEYYEEAHQNLALADQVLKLPHNASPMSQDICKTAILSAAGDVFLASGDLINAEKKYRAAMEVDLPQPKKFNEVYRKTASSYLEKISR